MSAPVSPELTRWLSDPAHRTEVADADVVLAVDPAHEKPWLLYGAHHLRQIVDSGRSEGLEILSITVNAAPEWLDLEYAQAAVNVIKGVGGAR
jgi:hypothetical protein